MATTRLTFLTPNDTTGLDCKLRDDLTKEEVDTDVSCDTVALLATAIVATSLTSNH
jgi:hypothetical protein